MGPQFKDSSEGLEKPEIKRMTHVLQGKWLTTEQQNLQKLLEI